MTPVSLIVCNLSYTLLSAHQNSSKPRDSLDCPPESEYYSSSVSGEEIQYEEPRFPGYIRYTSTVFCVIILVLGIAGNIVVPIVVSKTKELNNSTNIFLVNLSVADLLVLIVCMPTVLLELHSKPEIWPLGVEMSCHIGGRAYHIGGLAYYIGGLAYHIGGHGFKLGWFHRERYSLLTKKKKWYQR